MSMVPTSVVAVVGGLGLATYLALPSSVAVAAYPAFGMVLVACVLWGVFSGRIVHGRGAWLLFALGNALWVVGDLVASWLELTTGVTFPSVADGIYLLGYPVLAVAIVWASRLRGPHRDAVGCLDGLMVAMAAAIPIWVLWIGPSVQDVSPAGLDLVVTLAYPLMDVLLIACGTRFVLGGGRWSAAAVLGVSGLAANVVADVAYNVAALAGSYQPPDPLDLGFLLAYLIWILMAVHPSASTLLEGGHRPAGVPYRARTWALVAVVVLPLSVLAVSYVEGDPIDGWIVTVALAIITVAMVLRLWLIARAGSSAWRGPALLSSAALVVVVAAVGLTSLQQRSTRADATANGLMDAAAAAERLDGIAVRSDRPGPDGADARRAWSGQIAALRRHLDTAGVTPAVRRSLGSLLENYETALTRQLVAVDARDLVAGAEIERREIVPAHTAFIEGARAAAAESRARSDRAAKRARFTTVLALAVSLAFLALLLVRVGGVGRRDELAHQALHDSLTGLPNRGMIEEKLRHAFSRARRSTQGLVLLDLDDFKALNDSLGHPVGNELLVALAERLAAAVPDSGGLLARIGGDGFAILLDDIEGPECAVATAERMLALLQTPFAIAGSTHLAHASVGIAVSDGSGTGSASERAATVLRDAELAMYAAKDREGNSHELFTAEMHDAVAKRLKLKAELALAIQREEFTLVYQPIVDIAEGRVVGYEALVRWVHPERGFVSPADFIPVAEQTGLIVELGTWVLREACRQVAEWRRDWHDDRYISVNVAGNQLQREDFPEQVAAALAETGLPASALLLEVTESSLILDLDGSQRRMDAVRSLGVRFAIDDFGTGYSSLSYLSRFPLDVLKIDKSFIDEITTGSRGRAIVDAVVRMAASLDLAVVAEGIEEPEQKQVLQEIGCGLGQGYFYARPLPAADVPGFALAPAPAPLRLAKTA